MRIYTRRGDDGTTGLLFGGRIGKDDSGPEAYGAVDESVAALGVVRALGSDVSEAVLAVQRDLFVVAAELATSEENRSNLTAGESLVTAGMVERLEQRIDVLDETHGMPTEFIVPGGSPVAAALDVARAAVRRAERRAVAHVRSSGISGTEAIRYLNRLADYLYMLARSQETEWESSKEREA